MEMGTINAHANTMKTFAAKALRGAKQLCRHSGTVSAIWAIALGNRGHGAVFSDDLVLDKDTLETLAVSDL